MILAAGANANPCACNPLKTKTRSSHSSYLCLSINGDATRVLVHFICHQCWHRLSFFPLKRVCSEKMPCQHKKKTRIHCFRLREHNLCYACVAFRSISVCRTKHLCVWIVLRVASTLTQHNRMGFYRSSGNFSPHPNARAWSKRISHVQKSFSVDTCTLFRSSQNSTPKKIHFVRFSLKTMRVVSNQMRRKKNSLMKIQYGWFNVLSADTSQKKSTVNGKMLSKCAQHEWIFDSRKCTSAAIFPNR